MVSRLAVKGNGCYSHLTASCLNQPSLMKSLQEVPGVVFSIFPRSIKSWSRKRIHPPGSFWRLQESNLVGRWLQLHWTNWYPVGSPDIELYRGVKTLLETDALTMVKWWKMDVCKTGEKLCLIWGYSRYSPCCDGTMLAPVQWKGRLGSGLRSSMP